MAIRRVRLLPPQARGTFNYPVAGAPPLRADATLAAKLFDGTVPLRPSARWSGRQANGKIRPHIPNGITALRVETLASVGLSDLEIAVALDLRPGQVREYYGHVIDTSVARSNFQVAFRAFELAKEGDLQAVSFWLRHRAGWKDKVGVEHSGPNGEPIRGVVAFYLPQNGRLIEGQK